MVAAIRMAECAASGVSPALTTSATWEFDRIPKGIEVKSFRNPVPSREVSLVYRRLQWKTPLIEALRGILERSVPENLRILKKKDLEVIGIEV